MLRRDPDGDGAAEGVADEMNGRPDGQRNLDDGAHVTVERQVAVGR